MSTPDDFLHQWEHIIAEVNKTEIPLEFIKKIVVRLRGKRQKTINLSLLRRQNLSLEEIEVLLNRTLSELGDDVTDIDFIVDAQTVADTIQPETDKLLTNLKK
jgi:hypothetical protein